MTNLATTKELTIRVVNGVLVVDEMLLRSAGIPTKKGTILLVEPGSAYQETVILRHVDPTRCCPVCHELDCECVWRK